MTCIVGWSDGSTVIIGGDSCGFDSSSYAVAIRADEKVFEVGPYLIGFTTSFRMGQILRFHLIPPARKEKTDYGHIVKELIPVVRKILNKNGYLRVESNREHSGAFLLGYKGALYTVDSDMQVGIPADGVSAIGCAEDIALGAIFSYRDVTGLRTPTVSGIEHSLRIACHLNGGVRPPFVIKSIARGSKK